MSISKAKTAIIAGAGPAGLTAARELTLRSDIHPVVFEATDEIGGISKTVQHNGNRIDIGGHRFFSKSERVMDWWADVMLRQDLRQKHFSLFLWFLCGLFIVAYATVTVGAQNEWPRLLIPNYPVLLILASTLLTRAVDAAR